jgi:hypothetical protein
MFEKIKKHFALKSCIKKLGPLLAKRYGKSKTYTPGQVQTTAGIIGINDKYLFYGYAMFCGQDVFYNQFSQAEEVNYEALRQEVGDKFFQGDPNFSTEEIFSSSYEMGGNTTDGGGPDLGGISGMGGVGGDN